MLFIVAGDIRDIKGPVYFPADYLLFIILSVVILSVSLIFLVRYVLKKKKEKEKKAVHPTIPPHVIAYKALEALKARNLPGSGKIKEYYFELSNIVRHYIENRFSIKAPEMTTEEFLFTLRDSNVLGKTHKNLLEEFLTLCDVVKFAKYGPSYREIEDSFNAAKRLIDETKTEEGLEEVKQN
jgi:hypothetical protein